MLTRGIQSDGSVSSLGASTRRWRRRWNGDYQVKDSEYFLLWVFFEELGNCCGKNPVVVFGNWVNLIDEGLGCEVSERSICLVSG